MITLSILLALVSAHTAETAPPTFALQDNAQRGERLRRWRERRGGGEQGQRGDRRGSIAADQTLRYGSDARQRILFFRAPDSAGRPPLAVYVHGGGWQNGAPEAVSEKPAWFRQHGWAFASVGYRLLPDAPVEQQAADVGAALRHLREQAAALGYDPDRILLLGHSAGAHLAALVSSDPQYAGTAFAAIRGTLPIDGAGYDVPAQIAQGRFMAQRTYIPAFGTDPARQRALSPITHVSRGDAPNWLILYANSRADARAQSEALNRALQAAGISAQAVGMDAGDGQLRAHMVMNTAFGTPGYAANDAVLALMRRVAGQ